MKLPHSLLLGSLLVLAGCASTSNPDRFSTPTSAEYPAGPLSPLARGHAVTALVQHPQKLGAQPGLTAVQADALDTARLAGMSSAADHMPAMSVRPMTAKLPR